MAVSMRFVWLQAAVSAFSGIGLLWRGKQFDLAERCFESRPFGAFGLERAGGRFGLRCDGVRDRFFLFPVAVGLAR